MFIVYNPSMKRVKGETKKRILELLKEKGGLSPSDLQHLLKLSLKAIHKHLKDLLDDNLIKKAGASPKVLYSIKEKTGIDLIEETFVFQDSLGKLYYGIDGFTVWSANNLKRLTLEEKISRYVENFSQAEEKRGNGTFNLSDNLEDIETIGEPINLKSIDVLSLRHFKDFGRTKMGLYMDIIKSAKNKKIMKDLLDYAVPRIFEYAKSKKADALIFIPPTRKRDEQVMYKLRDAFEKKNIPIIKTRKITPGDVRIEQKTIPNLKERIRNADNSFKIDASYTDKIKNYKTIVIVDDFVGSGATINQVGKLIKKWGFSGELFGIGIVGVKGKYPVEKVS